MGWANKKFGRRSFLLGMGGLSGMLAFVLSRKFLKILQGVPSESQIGETSQGLTHIERKMLPGLALALLGEKALVASQGSTYFSEGKGALKQEPAKTGGEKAEEIMRFFGDFLREIPPQRRKELNLGLEVLNLLPIVFVFRFRRFVDLSLEEKRSFLGKLAEGPILLYPLFSALKELVYLAHYHQPKNYLIIGYSGPNRKDSEGEDPVQSRYLRLMAGK